MSKWQEVTLSEVAPYWVEKVEAKELHEENYISADNMLPNKGGIVNSVYVPVSGKSSSFKPKDILISNIRPYFKKIWFADKNGGCSNDVIVFRANVNVADSKFIYYCLSNNNFFDYMMAGANGVKMPRGNKNSIPKYKINLPPLLIQKKIAKILSNYDDLIENNLKRIKLLEDSARLVYEEWFLRFRIDGKRLDIDPKSRLPFGWVFQNLYDLYEIKYGQNLPQTEITESGKYEVYGASGVMGYHNKKNISRKVVLITSRGNGSSDIHRTYGESFVTNNSFIVRSNNINLGLNFSIHHLKTVGLINYCSGSAQPQLTNDAMKNIEIKLPDEELLRRFNNFAEPLIDTADNLRYQNKLLKEARDILLPRLMTGMINTDELDVAV